MKPYFKPSMRQKYGYNSMKDLLESDEPSKLETLESMSYMIGQDFTFEMFDYENDTEKSFEVKTYWTGDNGHQFVSIKPLVTLRHGLCYLVSSNVNVSVKTVSYFGFQITFNSSLSKSDVPTEFEIYYTSPDSYHGIFLDDWAYFEPTF